MQRVNFIIHVGEPVNKQINLRMTQNDLDLLDTIVEWLQETKALPGRTITRQDALLYALHNLDKHTKRLLADRNRPR